MMPDDFWHRHTLADIERKAFFHFKKAEESQKDEWERTRQLYYVVAAVNGAKGSPQQLMPFIWDKPEEVPEAKPMTQEEVQTLLSQYSKQKFKNVKWN